MTSYSLNIADYIILFNGMTKDIDLNPSPSQKSFISRKKKYDLAVNVFTGPIVVKEEAQAVFRAPYVEEINGKRIKKSDEFWTVYKMADYILIRTSCPLSKEIDEALLVIRPGEKSWDIIIDSSKPIVDPITYPIDGLLLYYLTALNGDIFIHASGVRLDDKSCLFTGKSGKGKSTIAGLFSKKGSEVIHDDRLILRVMDDRIFMYNTPVYEDEVSRKTELTCVYLIDHGKSNVTKRMDHSEAMASIMSNCIQHHWDTGLIGNLISAILKLVNNITVKRLWFLPDNSIVRFIEDDEC